MTLQDKQELKGLNEADLKSILAYFYEWEQKKGDAVFLRQPEGNNWKTYSWREVGQMARRLVRVLQGMGLEPGDKVAIVSKNCYHWIVSDLALMMGGFVSVPFYPNLTAKELNQVLTASEARVMLVGKLDDWASMRSGVVEGVELIRFPHYPKATRALRKAWIGINCWLELHPLKAIHFRGSMTCGRSFLHPAPPVYPRA